MSGWRPNNQVTFNKWKDCDRCGFPWPEQQLKMQNGILVCPECDDEKSHGDFVRDANPMEPKLPKVWDTDE